MIRCTKGGEKMKARLDRFEAMMTQLIDSVGQIMESQTEMRSEMAEMKKDIDQLQTDVKKLQKDVANIKTNQERIEKKSDERYEEIIGHLSLFRRDQAVVWEKLAIHEKQIMKLESVTSLST